MRRFSYAICVFLAVFLHATLIYYFAPPSELFSGETISNLNYDLRSAEMSGVLDALSTSGKLWAYDPGFRAGAPVGVFVDTNSRTWQLFVYTLVKCGVRETSAFNLFILTAHLLAPLMLLLAAWLIGLPKWSIWTAYLMGQALWFYDSYLHWSWWTGSPDWALACSFQIVVLSAAFRAVQKGGIANQVLVFLASLLAFFTHGYSVFALVVPVVLLYLGFFGQPGRRQHVTMLLITLAAGIAAFFTLGSRFSNTGLTNASSTLGQGTISYLLSDFLGITQDTRVSGGVALRSGFRFLVLGAATITLISWKREKDPRFKMVSGGVLALAAATYLGGYIPVFKVIQPYRFVGTLTLLALIPASALVEEIKKHNALRDLPTLAKMLLLLIVLAGIPRLARDVVYFTKDIAPTPDELPKEKPHIADIIGFGSIGYPRHREYRHRTANETFKKLLTWFTGWEPRHGRILVDYWPLAEYFAANSDVSIVGGSNLRDQQHGNADLFFVHPNTDPSKEQLKEYLDRYAVGLAVLTFTTMGDDVDVLLHLNGMEDILRTIYSEKPFKILKTTKNVNYFKEGHGKVKSATTNLIELVDTSVNEDLVIKFHWLKTLKCLPRCTLEKQPIEGDQIGFIRIKAPHQKNIKIVNAY